ncbi:MAG: hypothetical protein IJR50_02805 [Treponema sp.]|nr:hypothetical protein [Treponema sp.]
MIAFASFIVVINIILWIVFLVKFKKLFSTDDIIAKVRAEMENMIRDIDRTTNRDINLIEDRTKRLQKIVDDVDRRLALVRAEEVKQASAIALHGALKKNAVTPSAKRVSDNYKKNSVKANAVYEITDSGKRETKQQHSLFDDEQFVRAKADEVQRADASYAEVPIIKPDIYFSETPITPRKSFNAHVKELNDMGLTVEQIAKKLSCSTTEVQLALDLL